MIEIKGAYNAALCFCDALEERAEEQIRSVCDRPEFSGSKIRIMPDVHAGAGCTIGTTMTITDKIVPGMVGVDIGCGMETIEVAERAFDFSRLDEVIRAHIPSGREVREDFHPFNEEIDLSSLRCVHHVQLDRARRSVGTLGGGNHFIEADRSGGGGFYLVVHSGSRHLGTQVANHYQNEAHRRLSSLPKGRIAEAVVQLKSAGREKEISAAVARMKSEIPPEPRLPKDLAYVFGDLFLDYMHDMKILQRFAALNRQAMADVILREMRLSKADGFTTIHNYIDTESMVLRKGAVSAKAGERILIPLNMRDGSLICVGKGNEDWNCSAPHGAGRILSRRHAMDTLTMAEYREQMKGIFTTCVSEDTLDESPMAYKKMDSIIRHIAPTADVIEKITPVYNFKAGAWEGS